MLAAGETENLVFLILLGVSRIRSQIVYLLLPHYARAWDFFAHDLSRAGTDRGLREPNFFPIFAP